MSCTHPPVPELSVVSKIAGMESPYVWMSWAMSFALALFITVKSQNDAPSGAPDGSSCRADALFVPPARSCSATSFTGITDSATDFASINGHDGSSKKRGDSSRRRRYSSLNFSFRLEPGIPRAGNILTAAASASSSFDFALGALCGAVACIGLRAGIATGDSCEVGAAGSGGGEAVGSVTCWGWFATMVKAEWFAMYPMTATIPRPYSIHFLMPP